MKKALLQVVLSRGRIVPVKDFTDASCQVRAYLDRAGLGYTEWYNTNGRTTGQVLKNGTAVAHVSYNGRVWKGPSIGATGAVEIKVKPCKRSRS